MTGTASRRWKVEVTTTYYDVVVVVADDETQAREVAKAGYGHPLGGSFSESDTHKVEKI